MSHRPRGLTFIAMAFIAVALAMPLQVVLIYGHDFAEWTAIFAKLTWLNWCVCSGLLGCAALLWRASPYALWGLPTLFVLIALNNVAVIYYSTDYAAWLVVVATLGFAALNFPLMDPKVMMILHHPERRWWLSANRVRMSLPVAIEGTRLAAIKGETFNVSETGIFVPHVNVVGVGDWITVRLTFGTFKQFRCQGRVVRRSDAKGEYPDGVGIEFVSVPWRQKRELRRHLARQVVV
jgi:hypothetical protein